MKYQAAVLALWLIAFATTFLITRGSGVFSTLGPVFAVCMIGSVLVVRAAASRSGGRPGQ